jgi:hypothetical protein
MRMLVGVEAGAIRKVPVVPQCTPDARAAGRDMPRLGNKAEPPDGRDLFSGLNTD